MFATAAALVMLLMVADPYVVQSALADPVASPPADILAGNETPPPPPAPPPPEEQPQRPVEPGTVTQAWDNASIVSMPEIHQPILTQDGTHVSYLTSYGNFVFSKREPYFVSVYDTTTAKVADSAFLVLKGGEPYGTLLTPASGKIILASPARLESRYVLLAGKVSEGTLTVAYQFYSDHNKITASFAPSSGTASIFQIVWLTFTTQSAVDIAAYTGGTQRFDGVTQGYGLLSFGAEGTLYGTGGYSRDGMPGAAIRPDKVGSGLSLLLDVSDAVSDYETSYAGEFTFGGYSGNAVLITFDSGKLSIDPQLMAPNVQSTATAHSLQRKTFYDGRHYWLFWQSSATAASYAVSVDGKSWGSARTALTAAAFGYGFSVINSGKTVGLLWTDSAAAPNGDPTRVHIRTGLITEDVIQWDDTGTTGRQLDYPCCTNNVQTPVSAAFTGLGNEFGITWREAGSGAVGYMGYLCKGPGTSGFSPCATQSAELSGPDWGYGATGGTLSSLVVAFEDGSGRIARLKLDSQPSGPKAIHVWVKVYSGNQIICGTGGQDVWIGDISLYAPGDALWSDGLFTATAFVSNGVSKVAVFVADNYVGTLRSWDIDAGCNSVLGLAKNFPSLKYLSAGTDPSNDMYVTFLDPSVSKEYFVRVVPFPNGNDFTSSGWIFSSYTPLYLTTAKFASHFVPIAFTIAAPGPDNCGSAGSFCLYYSNYPLPLDGEAAVTNPWATKLGAPLVTDTGGTISPTTGLLATGQTLVSGQPAIGIIYREPGLFNPDGSRYGSERYQIIPGIYYDFPYLDNNPSVLILHMTGGQKYVLGSTGPGWFNVTSGGIRYTVQNSGPPPIRYKVTFPSGARLEFDNGDGHLAKVALDTTGQNNLNYVYTPGQGTAFTGTITDDSGRSIRYSSDTGVTSYGNTQSIGFTKTLGGWSAQGSLPACSGTATDSGKLQITDAVGRVTTYWVCKWKLVRLESPNGGRADYTYASTPIWQGTDAQSYPVTKMDTYEQNAPDVKTRSLIFNWVFQNGEVVRALVNTVDKSAVVQGGNEYVFNPAMGTASARTYDSTGQVLYYDMETLNGANMKDVSGNANDGVISGTSSVVGRYGKARDFSLGVNINAPHASSLNFGTESFTVGMWAYLTALPTSGQGRLLTKTNYPTSWWTIDFNQARTIEFESNIGTTTSVGAGLTVGQWRQITIVVDRTPTPGGYGYVRFYFDGVLASENNVFFNGSPDSTQALKIPESGGPGTLQFNGMIDEVRIFKRALSAEDIAVLSKKNAIEKGEQQNWYSINDMPHLTEGFVGDETSPSVLTQDAIDDWGNQIYSRNALGNETFSSYANTNHQNQFYAPGRLTRIGTSNIEFIDFSEGVFPTGPGAWTVTTSSGIATLDYGQFPKIAPSLLLSSSSISSITVTDAPSVTLYPRFIEFWARTLSTIAAFEVTTQDSAGVTLIGAQFTGSATLNIWSNYGTPSWHSCNYLSATGAPATISTQTWYRFTFEVDRTPALNLPFRAYLNGVDLSCGTLQVVNPNPISKIRFYGAPNTDARVDDVKIYSNANGVQSGYDALNIGFVGLQPRQSIALLSEDGTVVDQTIQTGTGTLFLGFNSALTGAYKYFENGQNAKSIVRIYAEDGTLEYQSPLTRFFVGEQYAYARPKAFADEVVKTQSGALYWPNTIYGDEPISDSNNCPQGSSSCIGTWLWKSSSARRNAKSHVTEFGYGQRAHSFFMSPGMTLNNGDRVVAYARIPSGKSPDAIAVAFYLSGFGWIVEGRWGVGGNQGPVPRARDQWVELVIPITVGATYTGIQYSAVGGEVEWDVTTKLATTSLTISGLNNLCSGCATRVSLIDLATGAVAATGYQNGGDTATIDVYKPSINYQWTSYPVQASIKLCYGGAGGCDGSTAETDEFYFGPLRDIWPADTFRYVGASSFFDSKLGSTVYWPASTIHTSVIGSKIFSGDCLDSVLCYDMETFVEGATAPDTGTVTTSVWDLSGKANDGEMTNPTLSAISNSATGLGTGFSMPSFQAASSIAASTGVDVTVTLPAHQANDIFLMVGLVRDTNDAVAVSGWTAMQGTPFDRGTTARYWLFWKRATSSSETSPLFDKSTTTGDTFAQVISYRGATQAGDPWIAKGLAVTGTTDPASLNGITTSVANALVVVGVGGEDDNNAAITTTGASPPSAYVEHYTESATSTGGLVTFSEATRSLAGATGQVSVDWDIGNPVGWGGMVLALAPAASPAVTRNAILTGVTSSVTISAWVYLSSASLKGAFVKVGATTLNGYGLGVGSGTWDTAGNKLIGLYEQVRWIDTGASIGTGLHHVVMAISATGVPSFYLDGAVVSGNFASTNAFAPSSSTAIGGYNWDGQTPRFFTGNVDQVLIYNKVLTATQILGLYHSRMPGGPQTYLRSNDKGFPLTSRTPYDRTYLYAVATYDSKGNVLSVTDVGRASSGGSNTTSYAYSTVFGRDYRTQVNRSDTRQIYYAYDFQTGVKYGTLGLDCRRSRTQYDAIGRPTQTLMYDTGWSEVLHLDMETATYNSLKDVACAGTPDSRNGQTVAMMGVTTSASGIDGMSRAFSGTGNYIRVTHSPGLDLASTYTLSGWINTNSVTTQQGIMWKIASAPTRGFSMQLMSDASLYTEVWNNGNFNTYRTASSTIPTTGVWYHVAFTFSSGTGQFYVNGSAIPTTKVGTQTSVQDSGAQLNIGTTDATGAWWNGKLDEIRVFGSDLSASDVSGLWQLKYMILTSSSAAYDDMTAFPELAGFPGTSVTSYDGVSTPRSLFYDMETTKAKVNGVTYFEDLSGSGRHGKVSFTSSVNGPIGRARSFENFDDYVTVGGSPILDGRTQFSFSAWVYPTADSQTLIRKEGAWLIELGGANWGPSGRYVQFGSSPGPNFKKIAHSSSQLPLNIWSHVVVTFDGAYGRIYFNGALDGTAQNIDGVTAMGISSNNLYIGSWPTAPETFYGRLDEVQLMPKVLSANEILSLFNGYPTLSNPVEVEKFPTSNSGTTGVPSCVDAGDWTNPTNAYANDDIDASVTTPIRNTWFCNEWSAFGFALPSDAFVSDVNVIIEANYTRSGQMNVIIQAPNWSCLQAVPLSNTRITRTFNFNYCGPWTLSDVNNVKVVIGASDYTSTIFLDYVKVKVRYFTLTPPSSTGIDPSHLSRTSMDGLGRTVKRVTMDTYGRKLATSATLGWNDKPIYAYLPSGQYSTFTYDFLGRTLTAQSPGDSTISGVARTVVSEKARMVESIDAVGRKAYSKTDLLGRTIETDVWNPTGGGYVNPTSTKYNALSLVTESKDAKGQMTTTYYNSLGKPKLSLFPDSSYSVVNYDDNLRGFQTVDVMGRVSVSAYDSIGRVTSVTLKPSIGTSCAGNPNPCVVTYGYDSVHDDLQTIDNGTARITRLFDSLHEVTQETLQLPSSGSEFTSSIAYQYDKAGKTTDIQYPTGLHAVYTYDSIGRTQQVDYGGSKYAVLTYDAFGRLDNIRYWKGTETPLQEKYSYDAQDRITQVKVFDSGTTIYMQQDYTYDRASQISGVTDNMFVSDDLLTNGVSNPKTVTYEYDHNGRLAKAVGPFGANQATESDCYDYDAVGNILHWGKGTSACPTSGTSYYTYNYPSGWNKLNDITNLVTSFTYNTAGSMTCKVEGGYTRYAHDFQQQLIEVRTGATSCSVGGTGYIYSYDGLGRRVKTVDTQTTYFLYAGSKMLYSRVGSGTETVFVYVGEKLLLKKEGSQDARYYHHDITPGNVRMTTYYTTSIQVDAKYRYKPFGDMLTLKVPVIDPRFKFAQQDFDSAARLHHMGARYHDPIVGRFIQRDPIGPGYDYASNNPISFRDSSGMLTEAGTWQQNFMNWLGSSQGQSVVDAVNAVFFVAAVATAIPTEGGSLALYMVVGGLVIGSLAVAITYVASGGHATLGDYVNAFALGFTIGATLGRGVYRAFAVEGEAALAAGKTSLNEARNAGSSFDDVASRAYVEKYGSVGQAPKTRLAPGGPVGEVLPKPKVSSPKLQNIIDDLYRGTTNPSRIGTGTTADAVRYELATGEQVYGTSHFIKAQEYSRGLAKWLRNNPNAPYTDRLVGQSLLDDLTRALGGQ